MTYITNNALDIQLPDKPPTTDKELFGQLLIVYNALRQLQFGADQILDVPPNAQGTIASYTWTVADRGHSIDCSGSTHNVIIPLDTASSFNTGSTTLITNLNASSMTITPASGVTLILAGTTSTGVRNLASHSVATIRYVSVNTWIITGIGVS